MAHADVNAFLTRFSRTIVEESNAIAHKLNMPQLLGGNGGNGGHQDGALICCGN
jgi:hypothetical protein